MKLNVVPVLFGLLIIHSSTAHDDVTYSSAHQHDSSKASTSSASADEPHQRFDKTTDDESVSSLNSVTDQWIITHPQFGIDNEYFYGREEATKNKNSEDGNNLKGTTLEDEFSYQTAFQLRNICLRFKNCKIYHQVDPMKTFPEQQNLEIPSDELNEKFEYVSRPLKSERKMFREIPAFPCRTHKDRTYWLTYGYADARIFLLEEVNDGTALKFVAQGEPVPKISDEYPRGRKLDDYFYKVTPKNASLKPRKMVQANPFVETTRFRLCCLLHAARESSRPPEKSSDSFTLNYANMDYRTIFGLHKVKNDQIELKEKYSEIEVRALGCTVNRKDDIPFYMFGDYEDPNAIFALELQNGTDREQKKFVVTEHFRNLRTPTDIATAI